MGFHAPQEALRILGEAIDFARKGQIEVLMRKYKRYAFHKFHRYLKIYLSVKSVAFYRAAIS